MKKYIRFTVEKSARNTLIVIKTLGVIYKMSPDFYYYFLFLKEYFYIYKNLKLLDLNARLTTWRSALFFQRVNP